MVPNLYPDIPHLDCHSIISCAKLTYNVPLGTFHEYTTTTANIEEHGGGGTHNLHISIVVYYFIPKFAAAYEPGYSPGGPGDEHPHEEDATVDIHLSDAEFRELNTLICADPLLKRKDTSLVGAFAFIFL